jgi:hypothetical protein
MYHEFILIFFNFFPDEIWEMLSTNIRGGLSFASRRYAESAVHEHISEKPITHDEFNRFNVILDIDANNLYGTCQTFPLPFKNFEFVSDIEKNQINWMNVELMGEHGYFVEVTLEYPQDIWEKTESFPLCPENRTISFDMLSPYQKTVLKQIYNKSSYKEKKLTTTFFDREKIILHALNLKLYLQLGMKIKEIYRVIKFEQKPFMKKWVDFCTEKRSKATNEFTKNFWKLLVNSVYGKTIESIVNRKQVKISRDQATFSKLCTKPNYDRHIIINENLVIVLMNPEIVKIDKPYYIGFSILEISKFIMYEFFYNILRPYFGDKGVSLLYSDTDSLAIEIKTSNLLEDLKNLETNMDFSNLNKKHSLFSNANKAQLFKFKEEFGLRPISRLCALKSKVYSFEIACNHDIGIDSYGLCLECNNFKFSGENVNKLKGIQKRTARNIQFSSYLKCLSEFSAQREKTFQIISKKQKIETTMVSKISLSSFCDKRFILNCGIHSRPYSNVTQSFCDKCLL